METLVFDTGLPADSVEVLPISDQVIFSIGTYKYDEQNKSRSGHISLNTLVSVEGQQCQIKEMARLEGEGVLDVCWRRRKCTDSITGCWANSDGSLSLLSTNDIVQNGFNTENITKICLDDSITMAVDMNLEEDLIVAAMSSGNVGIVGVERTVSLIKAHDLETWTVSIDPFQKSIFYSGGDDAKWRGWDLRVSQQKPTFTSKLHNAGVCTIQTHPLNSNILVTGGYDKQIALWDKRRIGQPVDRIESAAKSGVWKIKWHPEGEYLLAACMYDGFHIFNYDSSAPSLGKTPTFSYDPKNLSYGCSWLPSSSFSIISCSFYNHQVQLWRVNL